jgi:hypothetical protein
MAYVNAANQNWNTDNLQFEIINTIDGAVEALTSGTADYFMWERFMTKPLVDKGIFRRVRYSLALFCNCSTRRCFRKHPKIIKTILDTINKRQIASKISQILMQL